MLATGYRARGQQIDFSAFEDRIGASYATGNVGKFQDAKRWRALLVYTNRKDSFSVQRRSRVK